MAKIAIASEGEWVSAHFGHCPEYTLYEVEDNKIVSKAVIPNPGHEPGFLPPYLGRLGINYIIAGGMGVRAQQLFLEHGIEPILGVEGQVDAVVQAYLDGCLDYGESFCDHGGGACGEHHG